MVCSPTRLSAASVWEGCGALPQGVSCSALALSHLSQRCLFDGDQRSPLRAGGTTGQRKGNTVCFAELRS